MGCSESPEPKENVTTTPGLLELAEFLTSSSPQEREPGRKQKEVIPRPCPQGAQQLSEAFLPA